MKIILGLILMQMVYSLPIRSSHLFEMVTAPAIISKLNNDDQFLNPATLPPKTRRKSTTEDIILQLTLNNTRKTTRFRLPRRTRKRLNKTTPTTPTTTTPILPSAPISFSYPHTIFDTFFEKQNLILKVARYFNFTRISPELEAFYVWYYNALHDKQAEKRRNLVLQGRRSYFPGDRIRHEILDHTIFQVPSEHREYYVLVNDLAADTKDPTRQTFPKGVTFLKTTAMDQLLDDILYGDQIRTKAEEENLEDGPNIFYTTRPRENTTTVITTTTPEPEPFYHGFDYKDLYKDDVPWITTTVDYYEQVSEYLENYKNKIPSDEDDRTYFF